MKLPSFLNNKKILAAVMVILLLLLAVTFYVLNDDSNNPITQQETYFSQLTGQEVSKDISERSILGVMVENSEKARPQTGLSAAGIVFETTTEGGITRYLALYQDELPDEIGPVRSLRPAFVSWVMGFDAAVAHVGGSPEALQLVKEKSAKSLNQFNNEEPYYRSDERQTPHNMYVRTKNLIDLMQQKEYTKSDSNEFKWTNEAQADDLNATKIDVSFSSSAFETSYEYDQNTNSYKRFLAGQAHTDPTTKDQIIVKNVVVLSMEDSINANGEGKAHIFKNGTLIEARWEKQSIEDSLRLYAVNEGEKVDIELNKGSTWIAVIPGSGSVNYK